MRPPSDLVRRWPLLLLGITLLLLLLLSIWFLARPIASAIALAPDAIAAPMSAAGWLRL